MRAAPMNWGPGGEYTPLLLVVGGAVWTVTLVLPNLYFWYRRRRGRDKDDY